jgi:hypothetical protein
MVYQWTNVGHEDRHDAHVFYVDETKSKVVEIAFRIDASSISSELVKQICILAGQLVLMTRAMRFWCPTNRWFLRLFSIRPQKSLLMIL